MPILKNVSDAIKGKAPLGATRSSKWAKVRKDFLALNPKCAVCDGTKNLEVHHIQPFHLHPNLELDPSNLITLCESDQNGLNCHLAFGHLGSFKSFNVDVQEDSARWNLKIKSRPLS